MVSTVLFFTVKANNNKDTDNDIIIKPIPVNTP